MKGQIIYSSIELKESLCEEVISGFASNDWVSHALDIIYQDFRVMTEWVIEYILIWLSESEFDSNDRVSH